MGMLEKALIPISPSTLKLPLLAAVRQVIPYASPDLYSDAALRRVDERLAYLSYVEAT
jgi:hypothetical protein